jgi:tRNA(fMet)-specific endonuclease VapC
VVTLRYLLDTNVLSEPLRVTPDEAVLEALRAHEGESATAAPVWHELLFGSQRLPRSRRRTLIERYFREVLASTLPVLPYDRKAAAWHAMERARLSKRGRTPPFVDGQIAAIAATNDLVLVTANPADFRRFRDLRVEDWRSGGR